MKLSRTKNTQVHGKCPVKDIKRGGEANNLLKASLICDRHSRGLNTIVVAVVKEHPAMGKWEVVTIDTFLQVLFCH